LKAIADSWLVSAIKFFSDPSGFLSVEAGGGNKNTQLVIGRDQIGGTAYLGSNYLNRVSDNVTFNFDIRVDIGGDNTYTEVGLGLAFKLSQRLAVKLAHQTRGNTDIKNESLESPSSIDTATTFNLVLDLSSLYLSGRLSGHTTSVTPHRPQLARPWLVGHTSLPITTHWDSRWQHRFFC